MYLSFHLESLLTYRSHLSSRLPALLAPHSLEVSEEVLIKTMGKSIFAYEKKHMNY